MRYLVTGGAGFIGSNTVDELVRRGHGVVVLDDLSSGKEDNLAEVRGKITFMKGSITDIEVVQKAMVQADYVIHLAARTSVPRSVKDPVDTNRINVDGTLNVLVAARDNKVKRVVFAASSSAYGDTPRFRSPKICNPCRFLLTAFRNTSANFTPRPSAVVTAALANILACDAPSASGRTFNVATGHAVSLNQVLQMLQKASGKTLETKYEPSREGDIRDSLADIRLAKEFLGYEPAVLFEEGLERTYAWYQAHHAKDAQTKDVVS